MKHLGRFGQLVALVLVVSANFLVWHYRQDIADYIRLRNYQPSSQIAALATDTTMTDRARHLFYVNQPQLQNRELFNQSCTDYNEQTSVLGCYHGDRQGIYLYDVKDDRLYGVQQVTSAHEMLHQAYDRLSQKEKQQIVLDLQSYYQTLDDKNLIQRIDGYKNQGADIDNELHSILGTEIAVLPATLEEYYKKYFQDRQVVVSFGKAYQEEFTRREFAVRAFDEQLSDLADKIANNRRLLDGQANTLNQLNQELSKSDARGNVAAYNAKVDEYNAKVKVYNSKLSEARKLISQYNKIVDQRNAIAFEEKQLQQALDSRLDPSSTQ